MNTPGNTRWRFINHGIGLGLGMCYLAILLATARPIGFARDEGFYFTAARDYQKWFDILYQDPALAFDKKTIDKNWRYNREHPALMKTLFGFGDRLLHKKWGLMSPSTAMRFPAMVSAALTVYLIFLWGAMIFGIRAGLFAAIGFGMMPRVFYHAHLACFDMPITFMWLLVSYLYWRSLSSGRYGLAASVAFGFSLCVKLNAFFLPFVLGCHYVILLVFRRFYSKNKPASAPKPWSFVFGAVLAPPIFFAHWPWIWHDTLARLGHYLGFHSGHSHYNTAWFGKNVVMAPTPIFFPLVMTLITVPTTLVILSLIGGAIQGRGMIPESFDKKLSRLFRDTSVESKDGLTVLLLLGAAFPIALISLPGVPIFGGTKHWLPAYPFICLFAGLGAVRFLDYVSRIFCRFPKSVLQPVLLGFLLSPIVQQTITSHPLGLASYAPLIGGAPGAASLGMTTQFWGYTTAGVLPFLNANVPENGNVFFHDTASASVNMFREEGLLRPDIRFSGVGKSSMALIHHELHMIRQEAWIWNAYGSLRPVYILDYQGVPIVSVFSR